MKGQDIFRVEFETVGTEFAGRNVYSGVAAVLRRIADRIENDGITAGLCKDSKGNRIGAWGWPEGIPQAGHDVPGDKL